mgnify:CR=1 FL=1
MKIVSKSKKVLVTGADGFIGSHLVEMLVEKGAEVRALACYNSFNYWGWLEDIDCLNKVEVVTGDIRDPHYCRKITAGVDTIYHLASLIAIPYSYEAPDSYVDTNIKGTLNMCQAAIEAGCKRFVHTSTSEVYGTAKYVPIDEGHPLQPQSPYSATKIGADAIAMSFHNAFALPVVIARPFNVFGPRQSARAIIPTIISQLIGGSRKIKIGSLSPVRNFTYVEDTCAALVRLAACKKAIGQVVNIGSNNEISIGDLFDLICEIAKRDADPAVEKKRMRPIKSEVFRLRCDNRKLRKLTGFKPSYSLRHGLKNTIDWFSDPRNLSKYKTETYNV